MKFLLVNYKNILYAESSMFLLTYQIEYSTNVGLNPKYQTDVLLSKKRTYSSKEIDKIELNILLHGFPRGKDSELLEVIELAVGGGGVPMRWADLPSL